MNTLTLLLHLLLLISFSEQLNQVETTLEVSSNEEVTSQFLNKVKDQLQERFDRSEFKNATVEISEEPGQLVVVAEVDTENEKEMAAYRSLFASTSLDLWNTYRIYDEEIVQWKNDIGPIEGFDFNEVEISSTKLFGQEIILEHNGGRGISTEALGVCTNEEDKQSILDSLKVKSRSIPDLKLLWSPLTVDRYTEEAYCLLFMIKTNGHQKALLTDAYIANIDAYQEYFTNDPAIGVEFNKQGTSIGANMTKTAAMNNYRAIAIVINDVAYSAPKVINEITNGKLVIVSDFTMEEARRLAWKLEQGRLAHPLKVVSERILN